MYGLGEMIASGATVDSNRIWVRFVEDAIYTGIGPDTFFDRVNGCLDRAGPWEWEYPEELAPMLNLVYDSLKACPRLATSLASHQTLQLVFKIGKQYSRSVDPQACPRFYQAMALLFG